MHELFNNTLQERLCLAILLNVIPVFLIHYIIHYILPTIATLTITKIIKNHESILIGSCHLLKRETWCDFF